MSDRAIQTPYMQVYMICVHHVDPDSIVIIRCFQAFCMTFRTTKRSSRLQSWLVLLSLFSFLQEVRFSSSLIPLLCDRSSGWQDVWFLLGLTKATFGIMTTAGVAALCTPDQTSAAIQSLKRKLKTSTQEQQGTRTWYSAVQYCQNCDYRCNNNIIVWNTHRNWRIRILSFGLHTSNIRPIIPHWVFWKFSKRSLK